MRSALKAAVAATLALGSVSVALPAAAEEIVVGNYGVAANGIPYTIADRLGFFEEEGANLTGIISSSGGGTTLRNIMTGGVPYGEVNPGVVATAVQGGADLIIVSDNVRTVAEFGWLVRNDSDIHSLEDLAGHRISFTNPRSTSQALAILLLQAAGYGPDDAELVPTGGFGEGIVALDLGEVDVAAITEPLLTLNEGRFRVIARAVDVLPPLTNVVGVTTSEHLETSGEFIRAVIRARIRAIEWMRENPQEAGDIIAEEYDLDQQVARTAVYNLITAETDGVPYFGDGQIHIGPMERMVDVQRMVGAIEGEVDLRAIIDTRHLPEGLQDIVED
jgi:NitT/TauT family transport system substrate-binding protein